MTAPSHEVFAVEWNGEQWQSVFPSRWAEFSQLHTSVQDAATHIAQVAADLGPDVDIPQELMV